MFRNKTQNGVKSSDFQGFMGRYRQTLVAWALGLQNNVASTLGDLSVIPFSTKGSDKLAAAEVARRLRHNDRTSSRTRCKRIDCGFGVSKK